MTDEDAEVAQREAEAAAVSDAFQAHLWRVIDNPALGWARFPRPVARGLAETFTRVLVALAASDPNDIGFGLELIDQVERAFLVATGAADTTVRH